MKLFLFALMAFAPAPASAQVKAIMEGVPATNGTILISTKTTSVRMGGKLSVVGTTTLISSVTVNSNATISGNLGIGTTSPGTALDVNGSISLRGANLLCTNGGANPICNVGNDYSSGSTALIASGGTKLFVSSTSTVGIGTTSPATTLDVNGQTTVRSTLIMDAGASGTPQVALKQNGTSRGFLTYWNTTSTLNLQRSGSTELNGLSIDASDNVRIGATGTPLAIISTGTYTPTITGLTNVASVGTVGTGTFYRIGNLVHVVVRFTITPTAAADTSTDAGISLPVASNLAASDDALGVCNSSGRAQRGGDVQEDTANDRADFQYQSQTTLATTFRCTFDYVIK